MNIIFLTYGLSFLSLGFVIFFQHIGNNRFSLTSYIWLLGIFSLLHGLHELTELWTTMHGARSFLAFVKPFLLLSSYIFLFEFGRRITRDTIFLFSELKFFQPEIYFVLLGGILIAAILSDNFCSVLAICSRYLFGFFGSILTGLGFFSYCHSRKTSSLTHQASQSVKYASYITAIAFIVYGILGGLVVPSAPWFPANWLNQDTFLAGVGLPVQLFRSVCAVLMAVSINHILKVLRKAA